jgi:hypothetical protein
MSVDLGTIENRPSQTGDNIKSKIKVSRVTLKNAMNSFTVPPINCSFCSETAIASRGRHQQGKGQVWNATGYYGSRLNMLASSQLQPVQLEAALGKQSDPAAFSLRKGVSSHLPFHLALGERTGIVGAMECLSTSPKGLATPIR